MPPKYKIEVMTPDDHDVVHMLPSLGEIPPEAHPIDPQSAWTKATRISAGPDRTFAPTAGEPFTAPFNAPLGVQRTLSQASDALRTRGYHVLAQGVDWAGRLLPDSVAGVTNTALMGHALYSGIRGTQAPSPSPSPEIVGLTGSAPASPAAPRPSVPAPTPPIVTPGGASPGATAVFAFDWPEAGGPQYNVVDPGGPYHNSTVGAARLKALGIPIPATSPSGQPSQPGLTAVDLDPQAGAKARMEARLREQYYNNRNDPRDLRRKPGTNPNMAPPPTAVEASKTPIRMALDALPPEVRTMTPGTKVTDTTTGTVYYRDKAGRLYQSKGK